MHQNRKEYIIEQQEELKKEGWKEYEIKEINFDDEYYAIVEDHIKQSGTITQEVYNSLTDGQKYHFNKHYNHRNDKIINSNYTKEIKEDKKQINKNMKEN